MTYSKLKTRAEDQRLRGKNVGFLACGGYRGADSDGWHLIQVTCRPCGKWWIERARRIWTGLVTNCGCQGDDHHTIRTWVSLHKYKLATANMVSDLTGIVDAQTLDTHIKTDYPDDWYVYWRFRKAVGLAPDSTYALHQDSESGLWVWAKPLDIALAGFVDRETRLMTPAVPCEDEEWAWLSSID